MQIKLDRNTVTGRFQKVVWGQHAGKIWTAVRGGCSRNEQNANTVFGMVLTSAAVYDDSGLYLQFRNNPRHTSNWVNTLDAVLLEFEQHMVFAPDAVWLWMVFGECAGDCLVPKAELFHMLPMTEQRIMWEWEPPWQVTASRMCESLAAAVARDEYAREM